MKETVWYDPENDQFYLHDGVYAHTAIYTSVGGYRDSDGDTFYWSSVKGIKAILYGWINLGDL